jgi:uncharacterized protein
MRVLMDHDELLAREPDVRRLQDAYALLSTNLPKALIELEELAKGGSVLSMLYLANAYKREQYADPAKTELWYRAAYEKGALDAFAGLGITYFQQKKYEEAEKIFESGVTHNDGVSMYWLARVYIEDPRHKGRYSDIKNLFERSMALGQVRAKNQLAFLFMKGRYGIKNIPRGIFLYFSSAVDGFRVGLQDPDDRRLW